MDTDKKTASQAAPSFRYPCLSVFICGPIFLFACAHRPHVKLKLQRLIMRFGRIILAVLAPLVSLSALKTDLATTGNAASADSLTSLLRAVAPMAAVYAAETQQVARTHSGQAASPVFGSFAETDLVVQRAPRLPGDEADRRGEVDVQGAARRPDGRPDLGRRHQNAAFHPPGVVPEQGRQFRFPGSNSDSK
jgi:hypothetical protein